MMPGCLVVSKSCGSDSRLTSWVRDLSLLGLSLTMCCGQVESSFCLDQTGGLAETQGEEGHVFEMGEVLWRGL